MMLGGLLTSIPVNLLILPGAVRGVPRRAGSGRRGSAGADRRSGHDRLRRRFDVSHRAPMTALAVLIAVAVAACGSQSADSPAADQPPARGVRGSSVGKIVLTPLGARRLALRTHVRPRRGEPRRRPVPRRSSTTRIREDAHLHAARPPDVHREPSRRRPHQRELGLPARPVPAVARPSSRSVPRSCSASSPGCSQQTGAVCLAVRDRRALRSSRTACVSATW